jgi:hypothetical protein
MGSLFICGEAEGEVGVEGGEEAAGVGEDVGTHEMMILR